MRPFNLSHPLLAAFVAGSALACSSSDIGEGTADAKEVPVGDYVIDSDASYWDMAVHDASAYFVNRETAVNRVEVVDLETMGVVDSWAALDDFPAVPAGEQLEGYRSDFALQGVQVLDDGQVVVFGRRDDAYPLDLAGDFLGGGGRWQKSFVVQGLSADGSSADWSLGLDLRGLVQPSSALVQVEKMTAFVTDDEIAITFSHIDEPDRVFTVPRPTGHEMMQIEPWNGVALPVADVVELARVETPRSITADAEGHYFVAASGGLFRVSESEAKNVAPSLSFDDGYYLTDVDVSAGLAFATDHMTGLQVIDVATERLVDSVNIPERESGIEVSGVQIFYGTETGFRALDVTWEAGDGDGSDTPTDPVDDDTPPPEEDEDPSCNWVWVSVFFGGYWDWQCN